MAQSLIGETTRRFNEWVMGTNSFLNTRSLFNTGIRACEGERRIKTRSEEDLEASRALKNSEEKVEFRKSWYRLSYKSRESANYCLILTEEEETEMEGGGGSRQGCTPSSV